MAVDRGNRRAAGVRRSGAVITRLTEPDPAQLTFGQPMRLVADTLPGEQGELVVTWAFEPVP